MSIVRDSPLRTYELVQVWCLELVSGAAGPIRKYMSFKNKVNLLRLNTLGCFWSNMSQ